MVRCYLIFVIYIESHGQLIVQLNIGICLCSYKRKVVPLWICSWEEAVFVHSVLVCTSSAS